MHRALSLTFKDPSNVIDDAARKPDADAIEVDDFGNEFEPCPAHDGGHLFINRCGQFVCVHCNPTAWR